MWLLAGGEERPDSRLDSYVGYMLDVFGPQRPLGEDERGQLLARVIPLANQCIANAIKALAERG
jgi:hypothetical protein